MVQLLLRKFYITVLAPEYKIAMRPNNISFPWSTISLLGESYSLLTGNCQHFTEFALNYLQKAYSMERQGTIPFDHLAESAWEEMLDLSTDIREFHLSAPDHNLRMTAETIDWRDTATFEYKQGWEEIDDQRLKRQISEQETMFDKYSGLAEALGESVHLQSDIPEQYKCPIAWSY